MSEKLVDELRALICDAAPDPDQARPVLTCDADVVLDSVIPFSSLIVLGTVVAIEQRYRVEITRHDIARVMESGATLSTLARMLSEKLG